MVAWKSQPFFWALRYIVLFHHFIVLYSSLSSIRYPGYHLCWCPPCCALQKAGFQQANHLAVPRFFGQHFRVFGDSIHGFLGTQSTRICSSFETAVLKRGFAIARENRRKRGAAHVATHVWTTKLCQSLYLIQSRRCLVLERLTFERGFYQHSAHTRRAYDKPRSSANLSLMVHVWFPNMLDHF